MDPSFNPRPNPNFNPNPNPVPSVNNNPLPPQTPYTPPPTPATPSMPSTIPTPPPNFTPSPLNNVPPGNMPSTKKKSHKLMMWLTFLILLAIALVGGYLKYKNFHKAQPVAQTAIVKHDVSLIRFATSNGPVNVFYPSKDIINAGGMQLVNDQIYEGLVGWQGGTKLIPQLATGWANPDDSTWVFTLRQGVKFHTGRTLAAADVKYSLDKFKDVVFGGAYGSTIKAVTIVSPNQVKITTKGPDPLLLNRLANLAIIDSKATNPVDPANGTGPYILKPNTDPVKDKVTDLVAFDGYWGGHVYTRELQFSQIIKESDQVAALKSKQIDIFDTVFDLASIKELKAANISVNSQPGLPVGAIYFNTLKSGSPLGNLKVRQALNIGIDRSALITAAGLSAKPIGQYMVSVIPGFVPTITAPIQNINAAKDLITKSGIKNPTLTLSFGTSSANQALLAEFKKECAAIGVTINLDPIENLDTLINKFVGGKTDMFFASNSSSLFDGSDILSVFKTPGVYDNTKADKLLAQASQTLDGSKRLVFLQQAAIALNDDVAGLPIYSRSDYYAQTNNSYKITSEIPSSEAGAYFWKVYQ